MRKRRKPLLTLLWAVSVPLLLVFVALVFERWKAVESTSPRLALQVRETLERIQSWLSSGRLWVWIVAVLIAYLLLRRALHSWVVTAERWDNILCPRCGKALHRLHRGTLRKSLVSFLGMPLWRYECANPGCGWRGMRRRRIAVSAIPLHPL